MVHSFDPKTCFNIALVGGNNFSRGGIKAVLKSINRATRIYDFENDYQKFDLFLNHEKFNIVFISGTDKYHAGFDNLSYIKTVKRNYPEMQVCMYSTSANSLLWIHGDIDAYISLQDPVYLWRASLLKMIDCRYQSKRKPVALSLTPGEWRVLKEIRNGLDLSYIAEIEKLSYRRVSALKSSAIRKLGLRNKTDLLVFLTS